MSVEFSVVTDTATLAIFDLKAIRHRVSDSFDWWSIQSDEISEMNEGNIAFLNLGEDGRYKVKVEDSLLDPSGGIYLKVPSGRVFVGAGEDTSGGGLEPDGSSTIQGEFLSLEAGSYYMSYKVESGVICLAFSSSSKFSNDLTDLIRLAI